MTALIAGRHRAGRGNASPETARVRAAFADLAARHGRRPTVPEIVAALAGRGWRITPERVRVHLDLAGLRAGEGAP